MRARPGWFWSAGGGDRPRDAAPRPAHATMKRAAARERERGGVGRAVRRANDNARLLLRTAAAARSLVRPAAPSEPRGATEEAASRPRRDGEREQSSRDTLNSGRHTVTRPAPPSPAPPPALRAAGGAAAAAAAAAAAVAARSRKGTAAPGPPSCHRIVPSSPVSRAPRARRARGRARRERGATVRTTHT